MKIVVIGDIHGETIWEKIVELHKDADKFIFLGDYWDSFYVNPDVQKLNYLNIQKFRDEQYPGKVVTLLGNHDYHYIYPVRYSGWKLETSFLSEKLLLQDFKDGKLKYAYKHDNILFSHAGITNYWLNEIAKCTLDELLEGDVQQKHFDWNSKLGFDPYGNTISNSPIWVRPTSLMRDALKGDYIQVVGHTGMQSITNTDKLWFCDTIPKSYLIIEEGKFKIMNVKDDAKGNTEALL